MLEGWYPGAEYYCEIFGKANPRYGTIMFTTGYVNFHGACNNGCSGYGCCWHTGN